MNSHAGVVAGLTVLWLCSVAGAEVPRLLHETPAFREVSSSEMSRYLVAVEKLSELGMEDGLRGRPGDPQSAAISAEMASAVAGQGFDGESFSSVHWNVMMAYAALEMRAHQPELDRARAEQRASMEEMHARMPPEQYEQMMKAMSAVTGIADMYRDVPPANVELVQKHKAKLDRILKRERR